MKYLVFEGDNNQKFNATSKAREDINAILLSNDFLKLEVKTSYKRYDKKILKLLQIPYMIKNNIIWKNRFRTIKNSNIIIQYPALNSVIGFNKIVRKIAKNNNVILLIHDLDSLRGNKQNIVRKEDKKNLKEATYIICHNDNMKKEIEKMNVDKSKIYTLNIFDYLFEKIEYKNRKKENTVIIAGNLSPSKVKYIQDISKIENVIFNLYGVGYEDNNEKNIIYKGKYTPEELLNNLDGSFGLIWDGESIDSCTGNMGAYLKYNNPHKLSLYMAAGIPVIAWNKSAISKFITENNVGILVESLRDINETIKKLSTEDYLKMADNCKEISKKLQKGFYAKKVITEILNKEG